MPMPFPTAGPRPWWLVRGQSRLLSTSAGHGRAWRMVLLRCSLQVQRHRQALPVCRWTAASAGSGAGSRVRGPSENNHLLGESVDSILSPAPGASLMPEVTF